MAPRPFLDHDKEFAPYQKLIEYDNEELKTEILPLYRKMRDIFTEKIGLAEPDTRQWYVPFSDFVELWDRWLVKIMPTDVLKEINHSESGLMSFYADIEKQIKILKSRLR